jgi:iron complex transport system permease protein
MSRSKSSYLIKFILLAVVLSVLFTLNISLGSVAIPFTELILDSPQNAMYSKILWEFRLPKAITAVVAGSSLAVAGLQMQTFFRNPLAGPFVLGISAGASLGVALLLLAGLAIGIQSAWLTAGAAAIGSGVVLAMVLLAAQRLQDSMALLILGLMVGSLVSAVVSVLEFLSGAEEVQAYLIWTFGSLGAVTWRELGALALSCSAGLLLSVLLMKALNALLLGENYALSMGLQLRKTRLLILLSTGLLAGGCTAFCGPIAFVGLAVPHLVRIVLPTSDHKILLPAVALGGAILLLLCDILTQLPILISSSASVMPLNAITTLFGAPVVIWLILRQRRLNSAFA